MDESFTRLKSALSNRYSVERELGRGGMATVFLATDLRHKRQVAIKVLHPDLAASVGHERFLREIEILARLNHPNILGLIDSGQADGLLYYVMPFVEGESLRQRLKRESQLPIDDAIRITREVADALHYAHGLDIVHRDIKPENIMFLAGHAVVADFGIARAVTEAGGDQLTQTGLSVGTPYYMSPEQATGSETIDGRSDLYSLGCVLYEMVGGEPPYTGPSSQAILSRHSQAEIPQVSIIRAQTPPHVQAVIEKALAKSPADRFKTAEEMAGALDETTPSQGARRAPAPRLRRGTRIALAAVAVLAMAAVTVLQLRDPAAPDGAVADAGTIAILPFFEQGDLTGTPLTGQAIARILSNQLRAGRHRPVNAFMVQREVDRSCEPASLERLCGGRVAGSLNARFYVYGTATLVDDSFVSVVATPVDLTGERALEPVVLRGELADPIPLLDSLSVSLWLELASQGERGTQLAGISTDEPDALAAFINGELHLDEWQLDSAEAAYQTAVAIDSTFALAWYRLANIYDWWSLLGRAEDAATRAIANSDRLDDRDRRAVEAWLPAIRGDPVAAQAVFRELLEEDPDDVLVNYQLGYLLWAYSWRLGQSMSEAKRPLRKVLELAPANESAAWYLMWALAQDGEYEAMNALQTAYPEHEYWPAIQMIMGQRLGDSAVFAAGLDSLRASGFVSDLQLDMYWTGTVRGDVPDLALMSSEYMNWTDSSWFASQVDSAAKFIRGRLWGWTLLGRNEAQRGRMRSAQTALESMDLLPASMAPPYMAVLASLPLPGTPPADTAAIAERIRSWGMPELTREANTRSALTFAHKRYESLIRPYTLGLLKAGSGDYAVARAYADELEILAGSEVFRSVPHDMAQSLRADVLLREGRPAEALEALDAADWHLNYNDAQFAPIVGAGLPVFLRAMALQQLGRYEEALSWYENGLALYYGDILLPISHLHRGETHEAMGDTAQAIWHYEAFAELWKDADPEYQVKRAEILRQVAKLRGESLDVPAGGS